MPIPDVRKLLGLCSIGLVCLLASTDLSAGDSVSPIALDADDPDRTKVGHLVWRGGVAISDSDKRFGGLSALQVSPDGAHFVALSDRGHWVVGELLYRNGLLRDVRDIRLFPIRDPNGHPLAGKEADAESLAMMPDGGFVVAFERHHRLWRYDGARTFMNAAPVPVSAPDGVRDLARNGGIEALTRLCDGRLLAVAEKNVRRGEGVKGWLKSAKGWEALTYRTTAGLRPTGAATLPNCDIVFVERSFSILAGLDIRVTRVPARAIKPDAILEPEVLAQISTPLTIDNFEGIATRRAADGRTLIYLVSDDNFSNAQRTLLVMFELEDGR